MIDRLSHSTVDTYLTCSWKLMLEKVERVPRIPSWSAVGGSAVHRLAEVLDLADFGIESDSDPTNFAEALELEVAETEERSGLPQAEWMAAGRATREWPKKQDKSWWLANGQQQVDSWRRLVVNGPYQVALIDGQPAVEIEVMAEIAGAPVIGYVDRILEQVNRPDELHVVDLKSGSREPKSSRQLGTYRVLIESTLKIQPRWGWYFMTRKGMGTEPVNLDVYTQGERVQKDFERVWAAIQAGVFVAHPTELCVACGVKPYCHEQHGELADTVSFS